MQTSYCTHGDGIRCERLLKQRHNHSIARSLQQYMSNMWPSTFKRLTITHAITLPAIWHLKCMTAHESIDSRASSEHVHPQAKPARPAVHRRSPFPAAIIPFTSLRITQLNTNTKQGQPGVLKGSRLARLKTWSGSTVRSIHQHWRAPPACTQGSRSTATVQISDPQSAIYMARTPPCNNSSKSPP
jgi:hypothetical protein